ncbi:MAG: hypothetical protein C0402_01185 [Thermodesulfovibrio sp.]|nr:hypothetical protein [Thermodesulfovibrio sp.]
MQKRYQLITALILLIGLGSAALIYFMAAEPERDVFYDYQHSKKYKHELELYGGKANVLASDFFEWFNGLWEGRSLALTITVITIFIAGGYYYIASRLELMAGGKDNRAGPG